MLIPIIGFTFVSFSFASLILHVCFLASDPLPTSGSGTSASEKRLLRVQRGLSQKVGELVGVSCSGVFYTCGACRPVWIVVPVCRLRREIQIKNRWSRPQLMDVLLLVR